MAKVKIEIFEGGSLSATVSVPIWLMTGAADLLPKSVAERVDIDQLSRALKNPPAGGKLLEVEDHAAGERVVISMAAD
jgi:hypothetical protein